MQFNKEDFGNVQINGQDGGQFYDQMMERRKKNRQEIVRNVTLAAVVFGFFYFLFKGLKDLWNGDIANGLLHVSQAFIWLAVVALVFFLAFNFLILVSGGAVQW